MDRAEPQASDTSRKEKRQQAAAQRDKLRPLINKVKKTEAAMAEVEAEQAKLQTQLGDTDLYSAARRDDLADLLKREGELKIRAAQLEDSWLEQQQILEELESL